MYSTVVDTGGGREERTSENDWAYALSLNSNSCRQQEQAEQWSDPRGHFCLQSWEERPEMDGSNS